MSQAIISYEDKSFESLTQPWMVISNGVEVARFSTYMRCYRFINWHGFDLVDEQELAQAELEEYIETQAEEIAPEPRHIESKIEIDDVNDTDFGKLYRVWESYHFLGSFYRDLSGQWVAQPCNHQPRRFATSEQAQSFVVAVRRTLVLVTA